MRYLKSILIALGATVVILFAVSFFLNSEYKIEKKILIKSSPDKIYQEVSDLHQWPGWTAWNDRKYNSIRFSYQGAASGVGSQMKWKADGDEGKVTLVGLVPNRSALFDVTLGENWLTQGKINLVKMQEGTEVIWTMTGDVGSNFVGKYFILFADQFISSDMQTGLESLKKKCEKD